MPPSTPQWTYLNEESTFHSMDGSEDSDDLPIASFGKGKENANTVDELEDATMKEKPVNPEVRNSFFETPERSNDDPYRLGVDPNQSPKL